MRADICDANDERGVAAFRVALDRLGAKPIKKAWALGVDHVEVEIDGECLNIFTDAWTLDIEGRDELVRRVIQECGLQ